MMEKNSLRFVLVLAFIFALTACNASGGRTSDEESIETLSTIGDISETEVDLVDEIVKEFAGEGFDLVDRRGGNVIFASRELFRVCLENGFDGIYSWSYVPIPDLEEYSLELRPLPYRDVAIPHQPEYLVERWLPEPKIVISVSPIGVTVDNYWATGVVFDRKMYGDIYDADFRVRVADQPLACGVRVISWAISPNQIAELEEMMTEIRERMYSEPFWGSKYYPLRYVVRPSMLPVPVEVESTEVKVVETGEVGKSMSLSTLMEGRGIVVNKSIVGDSPYNVASQGGVLPVGAVEFLSGNRSKFDSARDFYESIGVKVGEQSEDLPGWHVVTVPKGWNVSASRLSSSSPNGSVTYLDADGNVVFSVTCGKYSGDYLATVYIK